MNNDAARADSMPSRVTGPTRADDHGDEHEPHRDRLRLQRRAVFLTELENARRMVARAREADRSIMVRELVGRRPIVRGR